MINGETENANLDLGKKSPIEIESKFLVKYLPENIDQYEHKNINQGYLAITEDGTEVRLRQKGDQYFQTVKIGSGQIRDEFEVDINKSQFDMLWQATEGKRVEKVRYFIPFENHIIELDVYQGILDGFYSAEIEMDSQLDSIDISRLPDWIGADITTDKRFKNQSLAVNGLPDIELLYQKDVPTFELDQGITHLSELIAEKLLNTDEIIIVEVAGGSASGKTSAVAAKIKETFSDDAMILSMDDYYRGMKYMQSQAEKGINLNWDQPEALNIELLCQHLVELKAGNSVQKPIYRFSSGEVEGSEEIQPSRVIILEGLFAVNDEMQSKADIRAFVDIGTHGRIMRRLLRDVTRTGQSPSDILNYFSEVVQPMHDKYIETTKNNADIRIMNEYMPHIEAERSGLHEAQLKFVANIGPEDIRRAGAERIMSGTQIDTYYNPKDRDLALSGESLRIREEGDRTIFTYKGPQVESNFRERPKFEFEINADIKDKFLGIYGDSVKVITKNRTMYSMDGVIFSFDVVSKIQDTGEVEIGKFIEIRSHGDDISDKKFETLLEKLKIDLESATKQTYLEM